MTPKRALARRLRSALARRLDPPPPPVPRSKAQVRALKRAIRRLHNGNATDAERELVGRLTRMSAQVGERDLVASLDEAGRQAREDRACSLTDLAQRFGTDKWGTHFYTPHYERHLQHLRDQPVTILEIGVGGYHWTGSGGESLRMWKHFFPHATVIGLDIEDKSFVDEPRITTVVGDQTDEGVLLAIIDRFGVPDIVIDDGSHVPQHVLTSFHILFPLLRPGAIYCIEDTQTSYWPEYGGQEDIDAEGTTMDFAKRLLDGLNHEEFVVDYEPTEIDRTVVAVHAYHNLVVIEKGENAEGSNKATSLPERFPDPQVND